MLKIILCSLMIVFVVLLIFTVGDSEKEMSEFKNNLLYNYPESYLYDSTDGIVTVTIADETVYALQTKSSNHLQSIGTIHSQIFKEVCGQLEKKHANVSLSKRRDIFFVHWTKPLYVPYIKRDNEEPAMMRTQLYEFRDRDCVKQRN